MSAGDLLRRARAGAVSYGRTTREDASELTAVFAQVAGRQATDALGGLERRLRGAIDRARRAAGRR